MITEAKRINNSHEVKNGKIVLTETYQKEMTREDLEREKLKFVNMIAGVNQQIAGLKKQRDSFYEAIAELDEMASKLPAETEE
jgi:SMC interacting uncharacterized protein involved in chromosome segregation